METEIQKENEEKKEYLRSYRRAVKREKDILDEIQRLRTDKMFPSVVNDGMPRGSSQSDLSDYIAILDEQIELLKTERLEKARCYQKIERQIKQMENEDEQEVLRLRYITGLRFSFSTPPQKSSLPQAYLPEMQAIPSAHQMFLQKPLPCCQ